MTRDNISPNSGKMYLKDDTVLDLAAYYSDILTPFNEILSSQRTPIIQINASYDISELRDTIKKAGNADIKSIHSEYELSLLGENDSAVMATASRGRYVPGYAAEAGVGIRVPEMPTGDKMVEER